MINWKYILLGAALVVVLGMVLRFVEFGTFIGMFVPGIIVGYLVNNGYKNGAKNGIITGIIGGFILGILIYYLYIFNQPPEYNTVVALIFVFALFNAVTTAILDAVGGIIGVLIRDKI
jgi:fructose-specific phosphotransferase system IIC component